MAIFNGSPENDLIEGTINDDQISGAGGNDVLLGGDGNDGMNGGSGRDWVEGGDGIDSLHDDGGGVDDDTLLGGAGNDDLISSGGADVIDGGSGVDTLSLDRSTLGASVTILGGATEGGTYGFTLLDGTEVAGVERLFLTTGSGNDYVRLTPFVQGQQVWSAGEGNDTVVLDFSAVSVAVIGGGGNGLSHEFQSSDWNGFGGLGDVGFRIGLGDVENVVVLGGSGNDSLLLLGAGGNDSLDGGAGNDSLGGGTGGQDTLLGGAGNDGLHLGGGGADVLDGGGGTDLLEYDRSDLTDYAEVHWNGTSLEGEFSDGTTIAGIELLYLTTGSGDDQVELVAFAQGAQAWSAGAGNDTATLDFSSLSVNVAGGWNGSSHVFQSSDWNGFGGAGDVGRKFTVGDAESFVVQGGSGDDSFQLADGGGADTIHGGAGHDSLYSGGGNDLLDGEAGNDNLNGGAGADTLLGSAGLDSLTGGAGSDTFVVVTPANVNSYNTITDLELIDRIELVNTNVTESFQQTRVILGETAVYQHYTDAAANSLSKGGIAWFQYGSDTYIVEKISEGVNFQNGVDVVLKLTGLIDLSVWQLDSTVSPGDPPVLVAGQLGTAGNDTLTGTAGADFISGLDGNDNLFGANGNDTLNGGANNDTLSGGAGADVMVGGSGNDFYVVDDAGDVIFEDESGDTDFVYSYLPAYTLHPNVRDGGISLLTAASITGNALDNTLYAYRGNNMLDGAGGTDTASFMWYLAGVSVDLSIMGPQNTSDAIMDTLVSIENLFGTTFNDTLSGDGNDNTLYGNAGNDALVGGGGNDTLNGSLDNDDLTGGEGEDIAFFSGKASDYTVTNLGSGVWTVTDTVTDNGDEGVDTLTGIEFVRFGDGLLSLSGGKITGTESNDMLTGTIDAEVIIGLGGNDGLSGDAGNDSLYGGTGNDTLTGGLGDDSLDGGSQTFFWDYASYATASAGVTVDLMITTPQDTGAAGTDTLVDIEGVIGSAYADHLIGNDAANSFTAGSGNDTLEGGRRQRPVLQWAGQRLDQWWRGY